MQLGLDILHIFSLSIIVVSVTANLLKLYSNTSQCLVYEKFHSLQRLKNAFGGFTKLRVFYMVMNQRMK